MIYGRNWSVLGGTDQAVRPGVPKGGVRVGARAPVLRGPGLRCSVVPGRFCPSVPPSPPREGHRAAGGLLGPGPEERGSRVSEITVTSVKVNSPASILQTAFNLTFFFFF